MIHSAYLLITDALCNWYSIGIMRMSMGRLHRGLLYVGYRAGKREEVARLQ